MAELIVDFQGFKTATNKFIIKELAAYDGERFFHTIFKAPFPKHKLPTKIEYTNRWLTINHHGLEWDSGITPYDSLEEVFRKITSSQQIIYVKGLEKSNFIRQHIDQANKIIELPNHPALIKSKPKCLFHNKNECICALTNVVYLYDTFLQKNKNQN